MGTYRFALLIQIFSIATITIIGWEVLQFLYDAITIHVTWNFRWK